MSGFDRTSANSYLLPAFLLQLREMGITDPTLLRALEKTSRTKYIPDLSDEDAWLDRDHSIGHGQSAGLPSQIAMLLKALALTKQDKVLEVGVGCGYVTALMARMCRRVYGLERIRPLTQLAEQNLMHDGVLNVTLYSGDGHKGWAAQAPFDAIILTAACTEIPQDLIDQLRDGGRIIAPIDMGQGEEVITLSHKNNGSLMTKKIGEGEFPPLVPGRVSNT